MTGGVDPANERYHSLDGLRGIAALIVVFHHVILALPTASASLERAAAGGGWGWVLLLPPLRTLWIGHEAVLLFFVLSGFVLALPWSAHKQDLYSVYLTKRIFRIYAPYLVVIYACFALVWVVEPRSSSAYTAWFNKYGWPALDLSLGNWLAAIPMTFSSTMANNPSWSLAWEMRISILFPLLVWPAYRWGFKAAIPIAAAALAINFIGIDVPRIVLTLLWWSAFFIVGIVLAFCRGRLRRRVNLLSRSATLALLLLSLVFISVDWSSLNMSAKVHELVAGAGAIGLIVLSLGANAVASFFNLRFSRWLGAVSYSLYLVHVPIISCLILLNVHVQLDAPVFAVISIGVSLCMAQLFHLTIERPSQSLGYGAARIVRDGVAATKRRQVDLAK